MNVTYHANEWNHTVADYYTGQCRYCGQFHRYYPEQDEDDSANREFEDGFFDCENHWNPSAECQNMEDAMNTERIEINAMFNHVNGGATDGRVANLIGASKKFDLPISAFSVEQCRDEKTGRRYGEAKCRRGWSVKLGRTTYAYQIWAVVKPEYRS